MKVTTLHTQPYASLEELGDWARHMMFSRHPDIVIGENDPAGPYLKRWWIIPRNEFANVYLHQFLRSDDDRAMHDHPWASTSHLISGRYIEHTPRGQFLRQPGAVVEREAEALHRIELISGEPVISLFSTGPKTRDWGFDCAKGWVPWQDFCTPGDSGSVGKGCGE